MKTYLLNIWDILRSSYWFIPTILVFIAAFLSVLLPQIDALIPYHTFPDWVVTTQNAAQATLSVITGAMVSVTGTVFSITIVTLSLTSQQFGPRLLRSFMLDRTTQLTLGVFLSTALYSSLVLRIIEKKSDGSGPPHIAVLFAVFLMLFSVAMLIVFIHHIAVLIQAPKIVANVANDLNDSIVRLFPESIASDVIDNEKELHLKAAEMFDSGCFYSVLSEKEGYIQAFDEEGIIRFAQKSNAIVKLQHRPGHFIPLGAELAHVVTEGDFEELSSQLNQSLIVGLRRTPRQDPECAVRELVEVAVRSLSPGINDPFTATTCVDRLGAGFRRLATRRIPSAYRCDVEGTLRLITMPVDFASLLNAGFNQIRQYSTTSVAVLLRTLEVLKSIAEVAQRSEDFHALQQHADMIYRLSDSFSEERDREDLRERYGTFLKTVQRQVV